MSEPELYQVLSRLTAVEQAQRDSAEHAAARNLDVQKELVRMDQALKGVREQAKAHNETSVKAIADVRAQMVEDKGKLEIMITNNVKELYTGIDKIVRALGLDDNAEAGTNLRENLRSLAKSIESRREDTLWIRRGVITIAVSGAVMVIWAGVKSFLGV